MGDRKRTREEEVRNCPNKKSLKEIKETILIISRPRKLLDLVGIHQMLVFIAG
jgi:hypothetical protein